MPLVPHPPAAARVQMREQDAVGARVGSGGRPHELRCTRSVFHARCWSVHGIRVLILEYGGSADMMAQKAGLPALNFMKLKQGDEAAPSARQGAHPALRCSLPSLPLESSCHPVSFLWEDRSSCDRRRRRHEERDQGVQPCRCTSHMRICIAGSTEANTFRALTSRTRNPVCGKPPWRQPRGKWTISLVNPHTNATPKRWHLWEIDLRSALNTTPGWRTVNALPP